MTESQDDGRSDEFQVFVTGYVDNVLQGLDERWELAPLDLYDAVPYEVLGSLIARQASLAVELARAPQVWTPNAAALFLRAMTEVLITIRWIVGDFEERAKRFYLYGLGQHKLQMEHYKARLADNPDDEELKQILENSSRWLEGQRREFFTDVDVGAWAGKSVREMARECDSEDLYKFAYTGFSSCVHSTWDHLGKHNVTYCSNPLHKRHRVPIVPGDAPDMDYLYRATKYLHLAYKAYDKFFQLTPNTTMPLEWFASQMEPPTNAAVRDSDDPAG